MSLSVTESASSTIFSSSITVSLEAALVGAATETSLIDAASASLNFSIAVFTASSTISDISMLTGAISNSGALSGGIGL